MPVSPLSRSNEGFLRSLKRRDGVGFASGLELGVDLADHPGSPGEDFGEAEEMMRDGWCQWCQ